MYRCLSEPVKYYSSATVTTVIATVTESTAVTVNLQTRMKNYLIQSKDIDGDFTALYFAMYMDREYGVQVGYTTLPIWGVNMKKTLLSYQQLSSVDCHDEYFNASQGSVDYGCCQAGSTLTTSVSPNTCCPAGTTLNTFTGLCEGAGIVPRDPVACPCCPEGYTYYTSTGKCIKPPYRNSDIADPVPCEPLCVDPFGVITPFVACPDLAPNSLIVTYPGLGDGACCETMVTPWDDCRDSCNDQWDPRNRHLG